MADAYTIDIQRDASVEVAALRTFDGRRIVEAVSQELKFQPGVETRRRKRLDGVSAGFSFVPPLWELKVGEYRVYYTINDTARVVAIRAVRWKGIRTTDEVLR